MFIKSITIKNFRSIDHVELHPSELTIFFGKNDVGKSNVLKVLNLFFNNQTDINIPFDFSSDFNIYARVPEKKAPEIIVKLELTPPSTFKGADKNVIWTKKWRKQGLHIEDRRFGDNSKIEGRTKLNKWMDHLHYQYVPAIKGAEYFEYLLKLLYKNLVDAKSGDLNVAGKEFIARIQENTVSMSDELKVKLGIESKIQLPTDLSGLFATLDFETLEQKRKISLKQRGDGVKVKHIPVILNFLDESQGFDNSKGEVRKSTIWGYEEPENNLELSNAFKLADDFKNYSSKVQILMTTHSPVFYYSSLKDTHLTRYYATINSESKTTDYKRISDEEVAGTNESMGLLPLISTYITNYVEKIKSLEDTLDQLSNSNKPILYFEGSSDATLFQSAYQNIFGTCIDDKFTLTGILSSEDGDVGTGAPKLNDFLYNHIMRLTGDNFVFAIFDADTEGLDQMKGLKKMYQMVEMSDLPNAACFAGRTIVLQHKVKKNVFALSLVVPDHRLDFFSLTNSKHCFISSELLLQDTDIPNDNRSFPSPRDKKIFSFSGKKVRFAEKIKNRQREIDFSGFKLTFDLINLLIGHSF